MLDSEWHSRFSAVLAKVFPFHVPFVPAEVAGLGSPMADLSQRFAKVVRSLHWRRTADDRAVTVDFQLARQPSIGAFVFADGDEHFVVFHHLMFSGLLDTCCRLVNHLPLEAAHDSEPIQGPQLPLLKLMSATEAAPRHATWERLLTMEFTADLFATETLVDSMLGGRLILIPPAAIRPGAESTETLLYMATFAVTTLFALFRSCERIHVPEGDRNYPSVLTRYATVVDRITKRLDGSERHLSARWSVLQRTH